METVGIDRAAFSLLATEKALVRRLGHRYRNIREIEDETDAPRETFFSQLSRLEIRDKEARRNAGKSIGGELCQIQPDPETGMPGDLGLRTIPGPTMLMQDNQHRQI